VQQGAHSRILQILDLARWAPSGDNTQPWRFEIVGEDHVTVHAFDTRDHCVYDLDGRASQLSIGTMLETLRLAAASHGLITVVTRRPETPEMRPVFDIRIVEDANACSSPLVPLIKNRTVQRRPLSMRPLSSNERSVLSASLPAAYSLVFLESFAERWRVACILYASARIRLTIPEAFETHRRVIAWDAQFSEDKIPDRAIGLDPLTRKLMRWVLQDWRRAEFMNRYMAGTIPPRLQLDLIPAIACAAHVLIAAERAPASIDDYTTAGGAVQRFWLTAATLGLQHQPEMTALIFARYAREGHRFSATPGAWEAAQDVRRQLEDLVGTEVLAHTVWLGRIGAGAAARSRSLRLPLDTLIVSGRRGETPGARRD
jgi:nitroreductase